VSTCVRPEPELPAPVDERRLFWAGSASSVVTRLRTLGVARPAGRAVLLLLLAWAPLLDAVAGDTPRGGTPPRGAAVGVAGSRTR
jgi:hypothetical protein